MMWFSSSKMQGERHAINQYANTQKTPVRQGVWRDIHACSQDAWDVGSFYTHCRQMAEITWSTLIMITNKKGNLPFGLWQAVSK